MINQLRSEFQKPIVKYGTSAVLLLIIIQYLLIPWFTWREVSTERLSVQAGLLVSKEELASAIAQLDLEHQRLSKELPIIASFFTLSNGNPKIELPSSINTIFEQFGLKTSRVSVDELEMSSPLLSAYLVSVEADGSVDKMFQLLSKLEMQPQFYTVERLTLYGASSKSIKIRLELIKYVRNS